MEHLRILFEYLFYFEFYCPLTHFMSRSLSIPPENLYTSGFLFSGGIEKDQCYETDQQISVAFILSQSNNKSSYFQSKKMFYPQLIVFLMNPQTPKSATSSLTRIHFRSYKFDCFFKILGNIKMKVPQILVQVMKNISILFLHLFLRLETSSGAFY